MAAENSAVENIEEPTVEAVEQERYIFDKLATLLMLLVLVGALGFGLIVAWFIEYETDNPAPQFFSATAAGQLLTEGPLDKPVVAQNVLFNWVIEAMLTVCSFNFMNYNQVIQRSAEYFTPEGYDSYKAVFQDSQIQTNVLEKKLILVGTPTAAPTITKEGVFADRYLWKMSLPMTLQYRSSKQHLDQEIVATVLVMRVPTNESPIGILIRRLDIEVKTGLQGPNEAPPV